MKDLENGHILIAAGTIFFLLVMMGAVMTVHMIGIMQGTYQYVAPPEFWTITKVCLFASVTILTLGGLTKWRAIRRGGKDDNDEMNFVECEVSENEETNA